MSKISIEINSKLKVARMAADELSKYVNGADNADLKRERLRLVASMERDQPLKESRLLNERVSVQQKQNTKFGESERIRSDEASRPRSVPVMFHLLHCNYVFAFFIIPSQFLLLMLDISLSLILYLYRSEGIDRLLGRIRDKLHSLVISDLLKEERILKQV